MNEIENDRLRDALSDARRENASLRVEVSQLRQRVSPATEPCSCPEFCSYHARKNFEEMKLQINAITEAWNLALSDGVDITPKSFEKLNHAILGTADKRIEPSQSGGCKCTESFSRNGVCTRCGWAVR